MTQVSGRAFGHVLGVLILLAAAPAIAAVPVFTDVSPPLVLPNGPSPSGSVRAVFVHPLDGNRLLALDSGGLKESRDAGNSWQEIHSQDAGRDGSFLVHPGRPGRIYRMSGGGLFNFGAGPTFWESDDFGWNWSRTTRGYPFDSGHALVPLGFDPADPEHMFALLLTATIEGAVPFGSHGYWVFRAFGLSESADGGKSWTGAMPATPAFGASGLRSFEPGVPAAPKRLFLTTYDVGAFVSTDAGQHWSTFEIVGAGPILWIKQDPLEAGVLYAATWTSGTTVRRSDDGGRTWQAIYVAEGQEPRLVIDPARPDRLWLFGLEAGALLSEDRGTTWTSVGFGAVGPISPDYHIVSSLVASPADRYQVYIVWNGHLYRGEFAPRQRVAIEYRYGDRFWITGDPAEAVSQDYRANDAVRTGQRFGLWSGLTAPAGAVPLCRFQGRPAYGQSSRFVAVEGAECSVVKSIPQFALEGEGEYYALAPDASGACAAGTVPVRRFNNLQGDVNHRYVADPAIASEMLARGWYDEGVRMCARPLGEGE
jgi:hypothetical protein